MAITADILGNRRQLQTKYKRACISQFEMSKKCAYMDGKQHGNSNTCSSVIQVQLNNSTSQKGSDTTTLLQNWDNNNNKKLKAATDRIDTLSSCKESAFTLNDEDANMLELALSMLKYTTYI
jgi:hypothetical protein